MKRSETETKYVLSVEFSESKLQRASAVRMTSSEYTAFHWTRIITPLDTRVSLRVIHERKRGKERSKRENM